MMPEWGRSVFSDLCVMTKPSSEAELASFVLYCNALVQAYLQIARHVQPPATNLCAPALAHSQPRSCEHLAQPHVRGGRAACAAHV